MTDWVSLVLNAAGFLTAASGAVWLLRAAWLLVASAGEIKRLPISAVPDQLRARAAEIGIGRLKFIDSDVAIAFCAGAFRPTVYVSRGLLNRVDDPELQAVLIHELDHARVFEPLWRAAWRAAAEVGFFFPLLRWAQVSEIGQSELRADRRAIDALGLQPVAGALWTLGLELAPAGVATFSGVIELRASHLLGDPLPRRLPQTEVLLSSIFGTTFALVLVGCIMELGGRAFG